MCPKVCLCGRAGSYSTSGALASAILSPLGVTKAGLPGPAQTASAHPPGHLEVGAGNLVAFRTVSVLLFVRLLWELDV